MARGKQNKPIEPTVKGVVGVGLDGEDGARRITRTEEMILVGGSSATHERMQETAIRFQEALESRGKTLQETPLRDVMAMLRDAHEKTR
ncbi:MAG: hypothetical protein ACRCZF_00030 [Gemmataceae bacterium]